MGSLQKKNIKIYPQGKFRHDILLVIKQYVLASKCLMRFGHLQKTQFLIFVCEITSVKKFQTMLYSEDIDK